MNCLRRSELLVIYHKSKLQTNSQCIMLSGDCDVHKWVAYLFCYVDLSVSSFGESVDEILRCGRQVTYTSSLDKEESLLKGT